MKKISFRFLTGGLSRSLGGCLLAGFLAFGLMACSSFSNVAERRQFVIRKLWVRETTEKENLGFRKINRMTPILAGDLLIQGNGLDGIVAYNRDSGRQVWRLPILNGVEGSASLIRDRLFFGASDGNFYSIEASTGHVVWSFSTKAENLGEPLLEDGVVYFLSGNNVVFALDASSGKQIWLYSRQDTSSFSVRGGSRPALKNGKIFVGFSDGSLVALNSKTGAVLWEVLLNRNKKFRDIDASPVVDGDSLYIPSYDDKLYCVSTERGEILWRVEGGGYSAVTLLGDRIIYPNSNGEVFALRKNNGDRIWTYKSKEGIATQVKIYKGMLVFGESQGKLLFLDTATGKIVGGLEPGRGILSSPLVDEKQSRVYFISGEANIYALEARWEKPNWYKEGWEIQ